MSLQRLVRIRLTAPWATLEEIADGILYLASDLSSFMTGHALVIDGGAMTALMAGKSLLAAGIVETKGAYLKGDAVIITDVDGKVLARGLISYASKDTKKILGLKSADIAKALGFENSAAVIHRDNMVLMT